MKIETCFGLFTESCKKGNQVKDKHRNSRLQAGIVTFIMLLFFLTMNVNAQVKHSIMPDEIIRIVRIGDVLMTSDGTKVFYSEAHLEWDKNKYKKTCYMIPSTGGTPQQFIGKEGGEDFQFSPNGKTLSLLREVDKDVQLFLLPVTCGEALQCTRHKGGIEEYKWSKDSKFIFFTAKDTMSEKQQKEWEKGADAYYVDEGPNGKLAGQWRNLYMFDIASKKETRLTKEKFILQEFDVSPDGKYVALAARPNNRQNYPHLSELYLYDLDKNSLKRLTDNRAPEGNLKWSPDGKVFLYRAPDDKEYDLRNGYFWIMNPITGKTRKLAAQNQGEVDHVIWMPDSKSLLFNEVHGTNVNLYRLDIEKDTMAPLTNKTGTLHALSFSEDRKKMVYSFSDFNTPADIYVSDVTAQNEVRLTCGNPWIEKEILLGKGEVLRWKSSDGTEIEGVPLQAMEKAVETLVNLAQIWAERSLDY